jgi:hypothetical protein
MIYTHRINPIAELRSLVASPPVRDLLLCAKHLFVAAIVGGPTPGGSIAAASTFGAGVVSLQLMKGLAMSRTITHMNPPAAVPHITGADT